MIAKPIIIIIIIIKKCKKYNIIIIETLKVCENNYINNYPCTIFQFRYIKYSTFLTILEINWFKMDTYNSVEINSGRTLSITMYILQCTYYIMLYNIYIQSDYFNIQNLLIGNALTFCRFIFRETFIFIIFWNTLVVLKNSPLLKYLSNNYNIIKYRFNIFNYQSLFHKSIKLIRLLGYINI